MWRDRPLAIDQMSIVAVERGQTSQTADQGSIETAQDDGKVGKASPEDGRSVVSDSLPKLELVFESGMGQGLFGFVELVDVGIADGAEIVVQLGIVVSCLHVCSHVGIWWEQVNWGYQHIDAVVMKT